MPRSGYFIDANLLVLLVAGSTNRDLITKHRRLREYSEEDYDILLNVIGQVERVYVTPNTLTEASNLLSQHADPERSQMLNMLRYVIHHSEEVMIESATASSRTEFSRLGLTDSALLEATSEERPLLTVDFSLYHAALQNGVGNAVNFTHLRNL